jgi:flagellar basal body-associated protein FliL
MSRKYCEGSGNGDCQNIKCSFANDNESLCKEATLCYFKNNKCEDLLPIIIMIVIIVVVIIIALTAFICLSFFIYKCWRKKNDNLLPSDGNQVSHEEPEGDSLSSYQP